MNRGFWDALERPIIAQAPMADVTDPAFRRIIAKYGKPDVLWTEQVSADGIVHKEGRAQLLPDLRYDESERPVVAQFFGSNPRHFYACAELAQELGFDGIDINMGCPAKVINKQCAGADLINNPALAAQIIRETKRGAGKLPVSVKTRVGYHAVTLETWLKHLLAEGLAAITLHARTRKEMSLVPARWEHIREAKEIISASGTGTLLLGNGDVKTIADGLKRVEETGADGVMIGRGIFGNPWLYAKIQEIKKAYRDGRAAAEQAVDFVIPAKAGIQVRIQVNPTPGVLESDTGCSREFCTSGPDAGCSLEMHPSLPVRLLILLEHARLFDELVRPYKPFAVMRKHFGSYVSGFDGAKYLRMKMMAAESAEELETILRKSGYLE